MKLRMCILRLAEAISRKTYFLDGLKSRLGISRLVLKVLAPKITENERDQIRASLDTGFIVRKIADIVKDGRIPEFWILLTHSMGDIVACEPIVRHLKQLVPDAKVGWIVRRPFRELLEFNPNINSIITVENLAEGKDKAAMLAAESPNVIVVDCHFDGTSCSATNKIFRNPANPRVNIHTYYSIGSLLETFSLAAGLPQLTDAPTFHFGRNPAIPSGINKRRIVFHCHSSEQCRDWTDQNSNQLASKLAETDRQIVEVGTDRVLNCRQDSIFDFTGYQDLQQIARIIRGADVFVGIDSVFAHVANAVKTPSVVLLGKYRNFESYFPYTGAFAHSESFQVVHAPKGQLAAEIKVETVFATIQKMLSLKASDPTV